MGDIFISYSRTDTDYAHKLADNLQSRGLHIWIDERQDDRAGRPRKFIKRLDSCGAFVVIMTPNSFASKRVQSELRHAKQKLKPIIPLWLEGAEPWLSGELTQFYDVRTDQLPDPQFYSALDQIVAVPPVASAATVLEEPVSAKVPVPSARLTSGRKAANIIVRLVAIALVIGAVTYVKPSGQTLLNSVTTSSLNGELAPSPLLASDTTPEPILATRTYEISLCCGYPGTQRSALLHFTASVETVDVLQIEFNMESDRSACSDLFLHILWDNVEIYTTEPVGPVSGTITTGPLDLSSLISKGRHILTISPEGLAGGCNTGALPRWVGKLIVHTNAYPK